MLRAKWEALKCVPRRCVGSREPDSAGSREPDFARSPEAKAESPSLPVLAARPAGAEEEKEHGEDEDAACERHDDLSAIHGSTPHARRRRRLFASTDTLENDIAAAASIGFSSQPVNG